MADDLPFEEVLLLEKIKNQLPLEISERFQILKNKRAEENFTDTKYQEYLDLIEVVEMDKCGKIKTPWCIRLY